MKEQKHIYNTILSYIEDKASKGKLTTTLLELCELLPNQPQQEIKDVMRTLHYNGIAKGGLTINKIPLIRYEITKTNHIWSTTEQE